LAIARDKTLQIEAHCISIGSTHAVLKYNMMVKLFSGVATLFGCQPWPSDAAAPEKTNISKTATH
jgi:hypothetical protein